MSNFYQNNNNIFLKPIFGIFLLFCLFGTKGYAQPFPVSVNTQLTSPSLPYLADYVTDKPETLRAILLLNDDSRPNYEVILKVRISGQGIELASRADYFSAPINLMYNVPEILTGFELADLFDPNNLEITGMSKSEFLKTGQLPEGIYTICFEAYDINRFDQLPVSNGGCAVASVIEHEPPYLIQPIELTQYTEPTILPFNWHPGHTISFLTEYRLYLYEDIPGWTEDQIILYQAPLYTTEVPATTYLYSAIDPLLERGASYFWRVQAYDPAGFEIFKNNGFSQLVKFTYGQDCDTPLGVESLTVNANTQLIRWVDNSPGTYELRLRGETIALTPTTDPTSPPNNVTAPVNQKNGKNNTSQLGGNNTPAISPTQIPMDGNTPPSFLTNWRVIDNITEQEYLLNDLGAIRYEIQVRRVCGAGNVSPWSTTLELDNRQPDSPEFLLPPEAIDPTEITEELFTANWNYQEEVYFELQVARDTGFAILVPGYESLTVTELQQAISGLTARQTYYYRIKAKRGDLQSAWSNVQSVQTEGNEQNNIASILALPAQPLNYEGFTANWTGTHSDTEYHLEVARDRNFAQFLLGYEPGVQQIASSFSELPITVDLLTQGAFYRIRTAGIGGIGYSNIIEVPRQYLPVPIALEPTDVNATGFTANWEALPEAAEYIIDVSTDPNFSEVIPELSNQVVSGTSISFSENLDPENTTYFYQVRAKIDGRTSGNSNPIVVSDGSLFVVPITEPATQIKKTSFWANWQNLPGITTYALDIATTPDFEAGSFVAGYENKIVYGESHKVDPVNFASTQYFYRVRAVVDDVYSIYSNDQNVNWKGCYFGPMAMDYSCGIPADPYFNEELPLIAALEKGDTIQAGDFLVILNEVNNSSPFSGTGYVAMPFQQVRLNLEFTNIKVDETCRMVDGNMQVTGAGLALISEEIADKINDIVDILNEIDNVLTSIEDVLTEISEVLTATESVGGYFTNGLNLIEGTDPIFEEYPYLPPSATDSLQIAIDCFRNTLSSDCKDALVQGLQILQNNLVDHFNSSQQIIFQASPDQVYGFDSLVHPAFMEHYQGITVAGNPYQISWKSVENGQTDLVEARTADGSPIPDNIRFEDADKNEIPTVIENGIAKLTITGIGNQEAYPIYAVETGDTVKLAGKLNIVSYDPKPINLVLVPINGATYPFSNDELTNKLEDIFQAAVVDLSLSIANNFQVADFDGELDAIATGFAKSYTDEMKSIFQQYETSNPIEEDTYYIFLLPRFANTNQLGYMPRKKQFGFVNNERLQQTENRYVKTLAHELAHGAFVLHHTFEQHPQLAENPTENLLDYSPTGTITHQYQWAAMHDPSRAWTLFDEDEERGQVGEEEIIYEDYEYFEKVLQIIRCAYANGETEIEMPPKFRKGGTDVRVVGFNYGLTPADGVLNGKKINDLAWTVEDKTIQTISGIQSAIINEFTGEINFVNFKLKIFAPHTNGPGITPFEHFRQYLFPSNDILTEEFETIWVSSGIQAKVAAREDLTSNDIRLLRKISNCGLERLDSPVKLNLIKSILDYPYWLTEHYEDLVLDVIKTTSTGVSSKILYELIFQDPDLVNELFDNMHDTGGNEKNFARLGIEIMLLYEKGFSKNEKEQSYQECAENTDQDKEKCYYFYGFNEGLCDWDISGEKEGNVLTLTEKEITETRPFFDVNSMSYRTHCDVDNKSYDFEIDEIIAVHFPDKGIKMIPALSYYIMIKSKDNQDLRDQLEITFLIITTITPYDEFYFLGKALQLAKNPIKSLRFLKTKAVTSTKKLKVALNNRGRNLRDNSAGKIDDMVDFVEPFDLNLFQQKYPNLTASDFQGLDEISDFQKLLDDDIASAINNFSSSKQADFFNDIRISVGIDNGIGKNLSNLGAGEVRVWKIMSGLPESKAWVRTNIDILEKTAGLPQAKQIALKEYYSKLKLPSDRPTPPPFEVRKQIRISENPDAPAVTVIVKYDKYGFPHFEDHMTLTNPKNDYKFFADDLNGGKADFDRSNDMVAQNKGFSKNANGKYNTNADGWLETSDYKWRPYNQNFFLKDANGDWVKHTWHHYQDGETLLPIPSRIHSTGESGVTGFSHSGGKSAITSTPDLKRVFDGIDLN